MIRAVAIVALAGCAEPAADMPPWIPAAEATSKVELGPPPAGAASAPEVLRIASWNVELAPDPEATAAEVVGSPELATASVLLVQEIDEHPGEGATRAAKLAAALGPGWTWFYAEESPEGDGTHGNAILARFPILSAEIKHLPEIHQAFRSAKRLALRATLDLGAGETLAVVDVHLDTRIGPVDRIRQLDPAVSDNPAAVVVGGDLNTLPWSWVDNAVPLAGTEAIVGQEQAEIVDDYFEALGFATPIDHDADTYAGALAMRLDAICPRGLTPTASGVARHAGGSDHFPVWVDLALP